MSARRVMVVFGTRPEAIKMAPVIEALRRQGDQVFVAVTAQHRRMLDQVLELFGIVPDDDLDLMQSNQPLPGLFARIHVGISEVITRRAPDLVLVHGDTSTTLAAALAAFYARVPIGHVEAGLRTGDMTAPWPEEMNRRLTAPLADLHFAPTIRARADLLLEGIADRLIHVTGNTVVDALMSAVDTIRTRPGLESSLVSEMSFLDRNKQLVLVTAHRRESFGNGLNGICHAIKAIAARGDSQIVFPVHLNPNVREPVMRILGDEPDVVLLDPQDYLPFVFLMSRADVILTDSGGIQEEAPSLGKPVLVMRSTTERPEAVDAGTIQLVGTDEDDIRSEAFRLLDHPEDRQKMGEIPNPYGDGLASVRIAEIIANAMPVVEPPYSPSRS